jgi:hypothetical protein
LGYGNFVRAAASCRDERRKLCALQIGALECGSLLPPWFGEACFALRNRSLLTQKPLRIRCRIYEPAD